MSEIRVGKYVLKTDLLYTESDEWVKLNGVEAVVGITDYAQKKLRDIVGVDLPKRGQKVTLGEVVAVVESVKAAADIYSPLSGEVTDVNEELTSSPELINKDPYGSGWLFKLRISNPEESKKLLSPELYAEKIKGD
ncbi:MULTISPECIES: glycine cleavage system protein GcvH [Metallosphaera]|uniref:glycine cleavage system protein GcvH n=1 Tax=Metallosphaera TaxID=41980 RepID=UPI001F06B48A|nr:glycine cleavage system protein GcvH [Metallosphaera sedula]MCH1771276.1 glycine cleavage system protein GcvH [Metallosphaera sedula]MCP6729666.1 glycine cleavage system protein GcvH [Metallosphaera sedula]